MSNDTPMGGRPKPPFGTPTYTIAPAPEPAWSWKDYERVVLEEWQQLLATDPPPSEAAMHEFLERHPCMLPGAFEIAGGESGHSPWFAAALSKPPLPSYGPRVPDFMWLSHHSLADLPILIEIEAPAKRWFTETGQQTAAFTQALDQLKEWKAWFAKPNNADTFKDFYGLQRPRWRESSFTPQYVLVYGRRAEANANAQLARKRVHLQGTDEYLMTYDRLAPNPKCEELMCVRGGGPAGFTAVSIPPTMRLGPVWAEDRSHIHDKAEAVSRNQYLSPARKQFLLERLPYWDDWGSKDPREQGTINLGDYE